MNTTVGNLEQSVSFMNKSSEEWKEDRKKLSINLKKMEEDMKRMDDVRLQQLKLTESMIDMQVRSMSSNLLFIYIPEKNI